MTHANFSDSLQTMDPFLHPRFYFQRLGLGLILLAVLPPIAQAAPSPAPTNAAPVAPLTATNAPAVAPMSAALETNPPPLVLQVPTPTPQPIRPPTPFATGGTLSVLALPGHFPDWLKTSLEEKLKTKIEVHTYATPEEAATDLAGPGTHIDLALIPDRIIPGLIQAKALRPLPATLGVPPDHVYLGHDHIDRDNRFAWPYAWSLVELAYNSTVAKTAPQHWIDLAAAETARQTFFADLPSRKALAEKGERWAEAKHLSETTPSGLQVEATEADAAYRVGCYGPLRQALANQPNWKYVLPEEGSIIFLYHLVLPVGGINPAVADTAVALFMDPANTARLASENGLAVTQKEALLLVPTESAHDPLLYPSFSIMSRSSFAKP